jgi:hypothetical protein
VDRPGTDTLANPGHTQISPWKPFQNAMSVTKLPIFFARAADPALHFSNGYDSLRSELLPHCRHFSQKFGLRSTGFAVSRKLTSDHERNRYHPFGQISE